jgi:hypothetical protein
VCVNFNLPTSFILLIIDNISILIYSFSHIYFLLNSTNHLQFYTSAYSRRHLSLSSKDNLYSAFHRFWCTGLTMDRKWAEAVTLEICVVQNETSLDTLIGKDSVRRWESNAHSAVVQPAVQSPP